MILKNKIYLSLAIFSLSSAVLIGFGIYPLFNGIKQESENLIFQKKTLAELEDKTKSLKNFQANYKNYQSNLEKIDALFINAAEPINFIEFLEKTASSSQLLIELSPVSPEKTTSETWPFIDFQLILTGSFPNFLKFLEKLESSPYLVKILNLNMRRLTGRDIKTKAFEEFSEGDINAKLLIKVYVR